MASKLTKNQWFQKVLGTLFGVAIGDALGMAVETMTRRQILLTTEGQGVAGYIDPLQRRFNEGFTAGMTTDDWALSKAVLQSLTERGEFDLLHMIKRQISAMKDNPKGYGKSTRDNLLAISQWYETNGKKGQHPLAAAMLGSGLGNGVAMKIAPLALCPAMPSGNVLMRQLVDFGAVTHKSLSAIYYGVAMFKMISLFLQNKPKNPIGFSEVGAWVGMSHFSGLVNLLQRYCIDFHGIDAGSSEEVERCSIFYDMCGVFNKRFATADIQAVISELGVGCPAYESVPFAICVALRHLDDFRAGVFEAVNAGGDTDTTASMVGAMLGARLGVDAIPEDLKAPFKGEVYTVADAFWHTFNEWF